ncbi:NAD(P)H-dependent oxidoreductase [Bacillus sp. EB01]|uniref:NAD(P)H-dependent oxidoreductase n=1 Tax=Bacillus sp. EB01 TaxID=1347086 RepID=UPI0005C5A62E|nr:NAD(P)H-dependent oxidoreductase [Bacillus sp. EB01]
MNILIVFAHPEPKSLNGFLKDFAVETLSAAGHDVIVSDLYGKNFKAVADRNDFTVLHNPEQLNYIMEQYHASKNRTFTNDILEEQDNLLWAEIVIFQFPIWWTESPAILKGWFDRVLAYNFAYGPGHYDQGNLRGKKAMLSITHGASSLANYGIHGLKGDLDERLFNIQHEKLFFCGMDVIKPFIFHASAKDDIKEELFNEYREKLLNIPNEPVLSFHPLSHYEKGQLKDEYKKQLETI